MRQLRTRWAYGENLLLMDRQIIVFVRDKHGRPLPGATILMEVDGKPRGGVKDSEGRASLTVAGPANARVRLTARYPGESEQSVVLSEDQQDWTFTFAVVGGYSNMARHILAIGASLALILVLIGVAFYAGLMAGVLPLALGAVLLMTALTLAFIFGKPTKLQSHLIRGTFALGAGAVASQIPGWLEVTISVGTKSAIAAGGAIAVYVISFFFVPAKD